MVYFALRVVAGEQGSSIGPYAECPYSKDDLLALASRIERGNVHVTPETW